ncbi:MAG: hypothetical protein Q4E61_00970, partial [Alphaproteobacteria bacterium]|nr:hypothetical protein [Alphaproteobacteria bacterium]
MKDIKHEKSTRKTFAKYGDFIDIDKFYVSSNPFGCNFRKADHTQQTGIGKHTEAQGNQEGYDGIGRCSRCQHCHRLCKFRKLVKGGPGLRIGSLPAVSHYNHKSGKGADHDG